MRTTLTLVLLAFATTAAHADNNDEVTTGSQFRALRSNSANAVTDSSMSGGIVSYARRLEVSLIPRLETWLTGTIAGGGTTGSLFQTMSTDVDTVAFTGGGRARYLLHRNVAVSARIDVGPARTALEIRSNGHTVS